MVELDRRARNKARTRAALLDVGLRLFRESGFDQTTVEEIADGAEVAPRTFYRYFRRKEELLFARWQDALGPSQAALLARPSDEAPLDSLAHVARAFLAGQEAEREYWAFVYRLSCENPTVANFERSHVEPSFAQMLVEVFTARDVPSVRARLLGSVGPVVMTQAKVLWLNDASRTFVDCFDEALTELRALCP